MNFCLWTLDVTESMATLPHICANQNCQTLFIIGGASGKGDASDEDDDNEFFDAMEDPAEFITVPADPKYHKFVTVSVVLFFNGNLIFLLFSLT